MSKLNDRIYRDSYSIFRSSGMSIFESLKARHKLAQELKELNEAWK